MSESGTKLLGALKRVQDFFGDCATLLASTDQLMADQSWEPIGGSGCVFDTSASVSHGKQWVPHVAMRRYVCEEQRNIKCMVSLLFDDFGGTVHISEPI